MLEKVKTIFSIIGAVLAVVLFTVILFLLRRSKTDGRGSSDDTERDTRIKEGIAECQDSVGRCEEHLQRAEDILRRAVKRSREEAGEAGNGGDCD